VKMLGSGSEDEWRPRRRTRRAAAEKKYGLLVIEFLKNVTGTVFPALLLTVFIANSGILLCHVLRHLDLTLCCTEFPALGLSALRLN